MPGDFLLTVADKLGGRLMKLVAPAENRDGAVGICP